MHVWWQAHSLWDDVLHIQKIKVALSSHLSVLLSRMPHWEGYFDPQVERRNCAIWVGGGLAYFVEDERRWQAKQTFGKPKWMLSPLFKVKQIEWLNLCSIMLNYISCISSCKMDQIQFTFLTPWLLHFFFLFLVPKFLFSFGDTHDCPHMFLFLR